MRQLFQVTIDLIREAFARKWLLGLFLVITVVLLLLAFTLRLEVVDGAISSSKLFGAILFNDIIMPSRALGALYMGVAYGSFYAESLFLCLACSDFATNLLAPGRIEHMLALPISRWQLLFGTYLGVLLVVMLCIAYGASGVTILFGLKTGWWTWRLLSGSLLGMVGFSATYAAMLSITFFVRSAALSSASGVSTMILGVISSQREEIMAAIEPGFGRTLFYWIMEPVPRLGALATAGASLAGERPIDLADVSRLIVSVLLFAAALIAVAMWRFEREDY